MLDLWVLGFRILAFFVSWILWARGFYDASICEFSGSGLFDSWGVAGEAGGEGSASSYDGFVRHCDGIADFYRERRDAFLQSADRHLSGLCEWRAPSAGMFVWIKLPVSDADHFIKTKARDAKVLLVPGQSFDPHDRPSPYARAAFSTASLADMDMAVERLGRLLREST